MREMHLFAGIGGGLLGGLLLGHVPVCAVEIDPYCRKVLRARQADGLLPDFPIYDDVRQFDAREWRGRVDVVCGGTPCQPWSTAGKRLGTADHRHLWPEMARIVLECRPSIVFAENVSLDAFTEPWRDLRAMGYRVPPALRLGPSDLGGSQSRDRWWLLAALRDDQGQRMVPGHAEARGASPDALCGWEAVTWWGDGGVSVCADGPALRMARARAVGNAQIPAVARAAWLELERRMRLEP